MRAEFVALVSRFTNFEEFSSGIKTSVFTDVAGLNWVCKYINNTYFRGWIVGYSDKIFGPDVFIIKAGIVTFMNRVIECRVQKEDISKWDAKYLDLDVLIGLMMRLLKPL